MIRNVMVVAMHDPEQVLNKSMRMPRVCDHLNVIGNGLDNLGRVMRGRQQRPDDKHKAKQGCEPASFPCLNRSQHPFRTCLHQINAN